MPSNPLGTLFRKIVKKMAKIGIRWDSITWGHCDYKNSWWVEILRKYFYAKNEDTNIINLGVSWDTTQDLLERFKIECKSREPEVIIFAIWINDSIIVHDKNKNQVLLKDFSDNLKKLRDLAQQYSNNIVFIGITNTNEKLLQPIPRNENKSYYNKEIQKYNNILEEFCKENTIDYIPLFWILEDKDLEDGLHPNPLWHQKIAEIIKIYLEKNLPKFLKQ